MTTECLTEEGNLMIVGLGGIAEHYPGLALLKKALDQARVPKVHLNFCMEFNMSSTKIHQVESMRSQKECKQSP